MNIYTDILPSEGYYCVAKVVDSGFQHYFHNTVDEALERAKVLDDVGHTVFLAQASFKTPQNRKQSNVLYISSLWLDIDCGDSKGYPTQQAGAKAIKAFSDLLQIPLPTIVISGNGLYAHYPLDTQLVPATWDGLATLFKKACTVAGLAVDPARTADSASVLRPVGSTHRKDLNNPKQVRLVHRAEKFNTIELIGRLRKYLKDNNVELNKPKVNTSVNAEFIVHDPNIKMNLETVHRKCAQISYIVSNPDKVSEPLWYAMVGMARYGVDGETICHEWSKGYKGYSFEETQRKIEQHTEKNIAPTTCSHFNNLNGGFCETCKYAGKISTPLQLGREIKKEFTPDEEVLKEDLPIPPPGYAITDSGVVRCSDAGDEILCGDPIFPLRFGYDVSMGYETTTFKHKRPFLGWQEITLRSSLLADGKAFVTALMDKSVLIQFAERRGFVSYIEAFSAKLRKEKAVKQLASQQGWCNDNTQFLLGDTLFEEKKQTTVGVADNVPTVVKSIKEVGDKQLWINATAYLNAPALRGHAFALLAAAFGAPLMPYSGYSGAMVSLVGESGVGKSLIGMWGVSAYGDPTKLTLLRDDTKNTLMSRMGLYNNLPAYIDEISNIPGDELSELVYRVTQGREKGRLDKNAKEKTILNEWNTLMVASSNHSLIEKLAHNKGNASAEINRVFEYDLLASVDREQGTACYNAMSQNYGGVGKEYVKYLVANRSKHKENIDKIIAMIDKRTEAQNDERFWSAVAGVTIYGGLIASKLGLIKFEIAPLIEWVVTTIRAMRTMKNDSVSDIVGLVSSIIDGMSSTIMVLSSYDPKDKLTYRTPVREPRGSLYGRIELDKNKLWVNRELICAEIVRRKLSPNKVEKALRDMGICRRKNAMNLGAGTCYAAGAVTVLEFDLTHPKMGFTRMRLVDTYKKGQNDGKENSSFAP